MEREDFSVDKDYFPAERDFPVESRERRCMQKNSLPVEKDDFPIAREYFPVERLFSCRRSRFTFERRFSCAQKSFV